MWSISGKICAIDALLRPCLPAVFRATFLLAYLTLASPWAHAEGGPGRLSTIQIARNLAETKFKGYSYGDSEGSPAKSVDCVHFLAAVVEAYLGRQITDVERREIFIDYGWTSPEIDSIAAAGKDPRLGGVVYAMTSEKPPIGIAVTPETAKPGDLLQYWMQRSSGSWFGHSGVITRLEAKQATILSANQTIDGVAENLTIDLAGPDRRIYIVRLL
jgi:hypothetical protein